MAGNLDNAKNFFNTLDSDHLNLVDQFYDKNVLFQDPVHKLSGAAEVKTYYAGLYKNVESIRFEFGKGVESGETVSLPWTMILKTPSLNGGREMTVDGVSMITFNAEGKATAHRDYFDMGEFVYERLPLLKTLIGYIKRRLAGE